MINNIPLEQQCIMDMGDVTIRYSEDIYNLLKDRMKYLKKEFLIALYLNTKNKIIKGEIVSIGTVDASLVHPREVFRNAIIEGASGIVLVHNHPSGDPMPSNEDQKITEQLKEAGKLVGINIIDHIIIGNGRYKSAF